MKRPQGGKLADAVLELAEYAQRRLILTGTPMPNGLADLWSQITFLWFDQKPLGSSDDYLREIQQESRSTKEIIKRKISPLFFRITKSQLNLPRPRFRTIKCEMSPLQHEFIGELPRGSSPNFENCHTIRTLSVDGGELGLYDCYRLRATRACSPEGVTSSNCRQWT